MTVLSPADMRGSDTCELELGLASDAATPVQTLLRFGCQVPLSGHPDFLGTVVHIRVRLHSAEDSLLEAHARTRRLLVTEEFL